MGLHVIKYIGGQIELRARKDAIQVACRVARALV